MNLSTLFHAYWSKGNEDKNYKFIENNKIKRNEILAIINLVAIVLQNGMKILGVSSTRKNVMLKVLIYFYYISFNFFLTTYKYYSSNKNIK